MRTLDFKLNSCGIHGHRLPVRGFILVIAAIGFLTGMPMAGAALDENVPTEIGINGRPLKWSADKVYWDPTESLVVLNGNVKIVQGETVIVADNAQIFSVKNVALEQTLKAESVEKFVANGNVRIEIELGVATSERAVYFTETKRLVLSGAPAKFVHVSGDKTITGRTIAVDRGTGKVTFEGDVEAVIFSEDNL